MKQSGLFSASQSGYGTVPQEPSVDAQVDPRYAAGRYGAIERTTERQGFRTVAFLYDGTLPSAIIAHRTDLHTQRVEENVFSESDFVPHLLGVFFFTWIVSFIFIWMRDDVDSEHAAMYSSGIALFCVGAYGYSTSSFLNLYKVPKVDQVSLNQGRRIFCDRVDEIMRANQISP